jgi:hypothetical protein
MLMGNSEGERLLGQNIFLKCVRKEKGREMWTGFLWLRVKKNGEM